MTSSFEIKGVAMRDRSPDVTKVSRSGYFINGFGRIVRLESATSDEKESRKEKTLPCSMPSNAAPEDYPAPTSRRVVFG